MSIVFSRRQAVALAGMAAFLRRSKMRAQEMRSVSMALDWYPNANHAGIFLARDSGMFADAGIELDVYTPSDPTTVLQTVGAGRDDIGISYQTDVLLARAQGVPVVSVAALVQHPLVTVMALQTSGIETPADLAGKTVAYPGIPSQLAFLETMLEGVGLTIDDIQLINIGFSLLPALLSGQADAVMGAYRTHETILAEQQGYPVNVMPVEAWGVPDFYELVVVTSERFLDDHSDVIAAHLTTMAKGYLAAIDEPVSALDALVSAYPELDEEVERAGLRILSSLWIGDPPIFGYQDPQRWQDYAAWMQSRNLIPDELDPLLAFSTEYVAGEEAQAR
ncbi:ABC transporter substrate-binding protein [soil metagenome]